MYYNMNIFYTVEHKIYYNYHASFDFITSFTCLAKAIYIHVATVTNNNKLKNMNESRKDMPGTIPSAFDSSVLRMNVYRMMINTIKTSTKCFFINPTIFNKLRIKTLIKLSSSQLKLERNGDEVSVWESTSMNDFDMPPFPYIRIANNE